MGLQLKPFSSFADEFGGLIPNTPAYNKAAQYQVGGVAKVPTAPGPAVTPQGYGGGQAPAYNGPSIVQPAAPQPQPMAPFNALGAAGNWAWQNLAQPTLNFGAKNVNTLVGGVALAGTGLDEEIAKILGNKNLQTKFQNDAKWANDTFLKPGSGLGGQGGFQDASKFATETPQQAAGAGAAVGVQDAAYGVPGVGPEVGLAGRVAFDGGVNAVLGGAGSAAQQYSDTGKVDWNQVGQSALASGAFGAAAPVAGSFVKLARDVHANDPNPESGAIQVPGNNKPDTTQPSVKFAKGEAGDNSISQKDMQDIIDTHRKRFGDENVQMVNERDSPGNMGHYNYHDDMVSLVDGKADVHTFNHESVHKAIGQFLSDGEIEQLYNDIVKVKGGKSALKSKYRKGGYDGITWRGAAEEEIANTFKNFMVSKKIATGSQKGFNVWYWAQQHGLPKPVVEILWKLGTSIEKHFGNSAGHQAAASRLEDFYNKVDTGGFNGSARRDSRYVAPKSVGEHIETGINGAANAVKDVGELIGSFRGVMKDDALAYKNKTGHYIENDGKFQRISSDKTGYDAVDKAIKDMHDHYNNTPQFSEGSLWDIVQASQGKAAAGRRLAANLKKSLEKHFTKDERHAIYDELQGVDNEHATDATHRTAEALRALQENAHDVRVASKPDVGKVVDYAPRIIRQTVKNAAAGAGRGMRARLKSVMDIGSLESNFNQSRQVNKFVDGDGNAIYGTKSQLGLTQKGGQNHFEDGNGNVYQQTTSTTHELKEHTGTDYLNDVAPVQGIYHADTANLKVKQAALNELNKNPNQHGLFTREQVDANGWHDSMKEVNVTGLKDANGENLYATVKDATQLERSSLFGRPDRRSIAGKAYDAASNFATKLIVLNPIFHGANQLVQSAIAAGNMPGMGTGWARLMKGMATVTEDDIHGYLDNGGHLPSYGSEAQNALGRATKGISQVPSKAMADIEKQLRVGLYKSSVEAGMSPKEAIANIDKFLGDQKQLSRGTQRVVLFGHYLKTMGGAVYNQVRHPIDNLGANVNTVAVAAILSGMTYEYQQLTGNKDAYSRMPGEIGLIKSGIDAIGQMAQGDLPSVLTNHINPVAKEIGQQLANVDLFTGKAIDQGGGVADRLGHVGNSLVAPSQQASQVISGKRSPAEILENQLGLYSPHAKGYVATTNPALSVLNTDGAITGKNGDPTGEVAQKAYFKALDEAKGSVDPQDTQTRDQLNSFLDRSHDPKTGQSVQLSPRESINNAGNLFANDKLRSTVQQFERSQPSHDPIWDLPDDKLKALMQYRTQFTGDAAKTVLHDQATDGNGANWIDAVQKLSSDYYNNIQRPPGGKPSVSNGPEYPKFDQPTQSLIDNYFKADAATKRTMMQQSGGELSTAFNQIAQYTNAMRRAEGAPEKNDYPVADAETQKIISTYNALPQHDGKKGGNATRYAWSQAHPDDYAKMQAYMTQATMHSLIDEAAKAQFAGTTPSEKLLGDIKNLGQYDITTTKNADGSNQYALGSNDGQGGTGYAASGKYTSSSFSSSSGKKSSVRASGYAKGSQKVQFSVPHTAHKAPKVKVARHAVSNKRLKTGVAGVSNKNKPKVSLKKVGA